MPALATYQGKIPKIRWLSTADQYAGDSGGGGTPGSSASCVAGATVAFEDWTGYADQTEMRAAWPVSQDCASGSQVGGSLGLELQMTVSFGCGLGAGAGFVYHERIFALPDGPYRVSVPFTISRDPGFLNMGMSVQLGVVNSGVDTTLVSCSTAEGGELRVRLGAFDLEWGMEPVTLGFGTVLIQSATPLPPTPGEGGESPDPDGWCELHFGFPLAQARSWPAPSPSSEWQTTPGGFEDAWVDEEHEFLEGLVTNVPAADVTRPWGPQTGWDSPCGWQRFLEWARRGNTFEFWRDKDDEGSKLTVYLEEPRDPPQIRGLHRSFALRLRSAENLAFSGY